jgi:hypothetical protein
MLYKYTFSYIYLFFRKRKGKKKKEKKKEQKKKREIFLIKKIHKQYKIKSNVFGPGSTNMLVSFIFSFSPKSEERKKRKV